MAQTVLQGRAAAETATAHVVDLVAGASLMTPRGPLPVEQVKAGDRIITRSGAMRVEAVETSVGLRSDLLRISDRALGHERPEHDILVPAHQQILLRDWRAKAMFGTSQATVPARRLIDGSHIRKEPAVDMRSVRIVLPRAAVIYVGGLELAAVPESGDS